MTDRMCDTICGCGIDCMCPKTEGFVIYADKNSFGYNSMFDFNEK